MSESHTLRQAQDQEHRRHVPGNTVTCRLDVGCHVGTLIFEEPMKSGLGGPYKAEGYSSIVLVPRTMKLRLRLRLSKTR
jgi:hypothetical protein